MDASFWRRRHCTFATIQCQEHDRCFHVLVGIHHVQDVTIHCDPTPSSTTRWRTSHVHCLVVSWSSSHTWLLDIKVDVLYRGEGFGIEGRRSVQGGFFDRGTRYIYLEGNGMRHPHMEFVLVFFWIFFDGLIMLLVPCCFIKHWFQFTMLTRIIFFCYFYIYL